MKGSLELRDIIEVILKGKKIVVITTILFILIAGIAYWLIIPPKYESEAVVQLVINEEDSSLMENYIASVFIPEVYIQRSKNEQLINDAFKKENLSNQFLEKNLNVNNNMNLIVMTYTSDTKENAQKELQTILNLIKDNMSTAVQSNLKDLGNAYLKDVTVLSKEIENLINEYNSIIRDNNLPELLILQTLVDSQVLMSISNDQTKALANLSGELQNQLMLLQTQIKVKALEYDKALTKYQSVETGIENFNPDPYIRTITKPSLAEEPSSPGIILCLGIGLVIGLMIGLSLVFFRQYWRNTTPVK
ncbi:hypothetical protein MTP04_07870 [Lysinibacillus sp. PLM2]|nr:hypothetical protein MTP04_07870 [Lysinibacillus sp. PLM2]